MRLDLGIEVPEQLSEKCYKIVKTGAGFSVHNNLIVILLWWLSKCTTCSVRIRVSTEEGYLEHPFRQHIGVCTWWY